MEFSIQLSADYPDKSYGGDRVYGDMLNQAILADRLGFDAISITEHHLINCLMMPAPLQFAVKIAAHTERVSILTSIVVLPLHDMRIYAGEVVVADIFTNGRLMLGVGRGAFAYEMERLGIPMNETQSKFNESLNSFEILSQQSSESKSTEENTNQQSEEGGGCLIATATYGSEMAIQVQQLRELRDNQLLQTESGSAFMGTFNDIYYSFSPIIADYERENPYFKEAVKITITPMISTLSLMQNAETDSEVLGIGLSVIMLNLGMYLGVPAIVVIGIRRMNSN